jgi:hypothetical protein
MHRCGREGQRRRSVTTLQLAALDLPLEGGEELQGDPLFTSASASVNIDPEIGPADAPVRRAA